MQNSLSIIDSLYKPGELSVFLEEHGLRLTKALGQHFFIRKTILQEILHSAGIPKNGSIIEIGPGIGHLTWVLLEHGLTVYAVEKDRTFIRILEETAKKENLSDRLHIIHQDALETDFSKIAEESGACHVIGNLPYNVAVPIIFQVAYSRYRFESLNIMIQKEVGSRMMAEPSSEDYGRLSIVLKYLYDIHKIRTIAPSAFFPPPKVDSVFIKLTAKENIDLEFCRKYLERLVQIGFQHRRKKLRSQFKGAIVDRRILTNHIEELEKDFNLDQRGEEWPLAVWLQMAETIKKMPQDG